MFLLSTFRNGRNPFSPQNPPTEEAIEELNAWIVLKDIAINECGKIRMISRRVDLQYFKRGEMYATCANDWISMPDLIRLTKK